MAAVDLSVEELSDLAVSKLGELVAPVSAFTILSPEDARVKSTGTSGGVYQVEITNALPTAADNPADYEAMTSGSQTNVSVTTANIAVMQKMTNLQQQQGIPFATRVVDASKAFAQAIWDKCTAMMNGASYTDAGSIGASGTLALTDLQSLRTNVDSNDVTLLIEHSEAAPMYASDKDAFAFNEAGAYGFSRIYPVSNFTGGVTRQLALAASKEAAVAVTGLPLSNSWESSVIGTHSLLENFTVDSVGINAELRIWQNSGTKDLYLTIEGIFGISVADAAAGATMTHDV